MPRRKITYLFIIFIITIFLLFYFISKMMSFERIHSYGSENGIWLSHKWVGDPLDKDALKILVSNFKRAEIRHIFVHSGPFDSTGSVAFEKYKYAESFIIELKKEYPEVISVQAWLGQIESKGGGILDISDLDVQNNIISTCSAFIQIGFDGIHLDIEPILEGDMDFLLLLDKIKRSQKDDVLLSVATPKISMGHIYGLGEKFLEVKGLWSSDYYREVSERTDLIVVMMYDTGIRYSWLYSFFVSTEVIKLTNSVDRPLLIGIPSYEEIRKNFNPEAENVISAISGIVSGLKYGKKENYIGFSIYAYWTTDEGEWIFLEDFLKGE